MMNRNLNPKYFNPLQASRVLKLWCRFRHFILGVISNYESFRHQHFATTNCKNHKSLIPRRHKYWKTLPLGKFRRQLFAATNCKNHESLIPRRHKHWENSLIWTDSDASNLLPQIVKTRRIKLYGDKNIEKHLQLQKFSTPGFCYHRL